MTCAVGLRTSGGLWLGADSGGFAGWDHTSRRDPKVFHNGPYMVAFTTSYRMGQILRYSPLPDPSDALAHPDGERMHRFMCVDFVRAVRDALRGGGWLEKEKERESGGQFLVAVAGRLYTVGSDLQVGEPDDDFDAVGCGRAYAVASLATSEGGTLGGFDRVRLALAVSERFCGGVRGPYTVLHQPSAPVDGA